MCEINSNKMSKLQFLTNVFFKPLFDAAVYFFSLKSSHSMYIQSINVICFVTSRVHLSHTVTKLP